MDVQRVHTGRLIVRVTAIGGAWSKDIDLTVGTPVSVADGMLTFTQASPGRSAGEDAGKALL